MNLRTLKTTGAMTLVGFTHMAIIAQTVPSRTTVKSASKSAPAPRPGVVSGRVFAITEGGDIKPARLAKVYLIYLSGEESAGKEWINQSHTASTEYIAFLNSPEQDGPTLQSKVINDLIKRTSIDDNWSAKVDAVIAVAAPKEKGRLVNLANSDIDMAMAYTKALFDIERSRMGSIESPSGRWTELLRCRMELLFDDRALLGIRRWRWFHGKLNQFLFTKADEEGWFKIAIPTAGKYLLMARGRAGFTEASWSDYVTVAAGAEVVVKLGYPKKSCVVQ